MFNVTKHVEYTLVTFDIPGGVIAPDDLAKLSPPQVDARLGVVISGRGPVWLFAFLCHHYHPTAWVGTYDPRCGGAIVVQSHRPGIYVGQIIPL